jgi:hypothetical protein
MDKTLFGNKLARYASREPKHFLQLDGFYLPRGGDSDMRPDCDGDAVSAVGTVELMHGATVRVLIPHDGDVLVAVRQLKKLAKWLKRNPSWFDIAKPAAKQPCGDFDLPF